MRRDIKCQHIAPNRCVQVSLPPPPPTQQWHVNTFYMFFYKSGHVHANQNRCLRVGLQIHEPLFIMRVAEQDKHSENHSSRRSHGFLWPLEGRAARLYCRPCLCQRHRCNSNKWLPGCSRSRKWREAAASLTVGFCPGVWRRQTKRSDASKPCAGFQNKALHLWQLHGALMAESVSGMKRETGRERNCGFKWQTTKKNIALWEKTRFAQKKHFYHVLLLW